MDIQYTRSENGIRIDKIPGQEALVLIPDHIEDLPVVELAPYVLSGQPVVEIHLPKHLRKIGAYAFYNCEKLERIFFHSRLDDLGAGMFTGAQSINLLDITMTGAETSCLREILSELRQSLRVRTHGERELRLLFPDYYEDMVENTPARILSIQTHGCGHRYRYCFAKREFQCREYDALFHHAQLQEPEVVVTELALGRLLYPYGLAKEHEMMYRTYIGEHWLTAGTLILRTDCRPEYRWNNLDRGLMPWFVTHYIKTSEQLQALLETALQEGHTEVVSWLMNEKHERFGGESVRRRRFEL